MNQKGYYRLSAASPYVDAGDDGKNLGADMNAINSATTCTLSGQCADIAGKYTLTVNVSGSGSVMENPAGLSYTPGTMVTLTAKPSAGYQFSSWTGNVGAETSNPAIILMNANQAVIANFTQTSAN